MTFSTRVQTIRKSLARLAVVFLTGVVAASAEEEDYHRFPRTVSPDGAYVLAWSGSMPDELPPLKPKKNDPDLGWDAVNFLVDLKSKKPVLLLPEFHYFSGEDGRQNHYGLDAAWTPDARTVLAVYDARWSYASVAWVDAAVPRTIEVGSKLEKLFRQALSAREGKAYRRYAEEIEVAFQNPAFATNRILIVDAWAQRVKQDPVFHYRMRFQATVKGNDVQFETMEVKPANDDSVGGPTTDETREADLNKTYAKLRARLPEAEREALKQQQLLWLKQREAIEDEFEQNQFTNRRLLDFHARLTAPVGK